MAHILIVDDEEFLRDLLSQILETEGHTCDQAVHGEDGCEKVYATDYDLIITDIRMPGMNGIDFLRKIQDKVDSCTPCMIITAMADEPSIAVKAVRLACDFLSKPFEVKVVKDAVKRALKMREGWVLRHRYQRALETELKALEGELHETYEGVLSTLAEMLEGKDESQSEDDEALKIEAGVSGHCARVRNYSDALARAVGITDEKELKNIRLGATFHDVGKYRIPDAILWKKGKLTEDEWEVMRRHPEYGSLLVRGIPFLAGAVDIIENHHERWDGTGYPRGLKGEDIPLSARIFGEVGSYDAMTQKRCYQSARSKDDALAELRLQAGAQFDARIVEAFSGVYEQIRQFEFSPRAGLTNGDASRRDLEASRGAAERIRKRVVEETRISLSG